MKLYSKCTRSLVNNCEPIIVTGNTSVLEGFVGLRYIPSSDSRHFSLITLTDSWRLAVLENNKNVPDINLKQDGSGFLSPSTILEEVFCSCDFHFYFFFTQYPLNISGAQTLKGTLLQTFEHLNILKMKLYHQMMIWFYW